MGCHRLLCSSTTWGCLPLCPSTTTTNRGKAIGNNLSAAPPPPDISTHRAAIEAPTGPTRPRRIQCTVSHPGIVATHKPHAPVRDTFAAVRYYLTPAAFCGLRRAHSALECFGSFSAGSGFLIGDCLEKTTAIFSLLILIYHHTNIIPLYYYYNIVFYVNNTVKTFSRCHCTREFSSQLFLHFSDYEFDSQISLW